MKKLTSTLLVLVLLAIAIPASAQPSNVLVRSWNRLIRILEGPMIPPPGPKAQAEPQSPPPESHTDPTALKNERNRPPSGGRFLSIGKGVR